MSVIQHNPRQDWSKVVMSDEIKTELIKLATKQDFMVEKLGKLELALAQEHPKKSEIKAVHYRLDSIEKDVEKKLDKSEFNPIKNFVIGLIGIVLSAILLGILNQVIKGGF